MEQGCRGLVPRELQHLLRRRVVVLPPCQEGTFVEVRPLVPAAEEAAEIIKFVTGVMASVGGPISLANWPLYVYETVWTVVEQPRDYRKALVVDIIDDIIKTSTHLTGVPPRRYLIGLDVSHATGF